MDRGNELRIGFFFFVGLLLLGLFTLMVGDVDLFQDVHDYRVRFQNVDGLAVGDTVRVAGLKVGKVVDVRPDGDQVLAVFRMPSRMKLYKDHEIAIRESSLVGGKYVDIFRGTKDAGAADASEVLAGVSAPGGLDRVTDFLTQNQEALAGLVADLREIVSRVGQGQGTIGRLYQDDALYEDVRTAMADAREAMTEIRDMGKEIRDGQGTLGRLMSDDALYNDLQAFAREARDLIEGIQRGEGPMGRLLADEEFAESLRESFVQAREAAQALKEAVASVRDGQGVLGRLIYDEDLALEVEHTLQNFRDGSTSFRSVTNRIERGEGTVGRMLTDESIYHRVNETIDSANKVLGPVARTRVYIGAEDKYYTDSMMNVSKVYLRIAPNDDKYFLVGGSAISLNKEGPVDFDNKIKKNRNQTILQPDVLIAYKFFDRKLTTRLGMIEGKLGGGLDYDFLLPGVEAPARISLTARDAYNDVDDEDIDENIHGAMVRLEGSFEIWKYLRVYAGASRLFDDPEFYGGLAFEYEDEDIRSFISLIGLSR